MRSVCCVGLACLLAGCAEFAAPEIERLDPSAVSFAPGQLHLLIARGGDSGAPVFFPNFETETASFYGIVVSSDGPTGAVVSNVTQIQQDLGPVSFF